MSKDFVTKVTGQAQDTSSRPPLTPIMIGDISPERMVDPALVLAGSDTAGDLPQAPSAPVASTGTSIPQGALAQSPATVISGGLAEALTSTDSTQMQSRLQPYQAWAQRFGEVLAQKLSLAVKDGNWSVKLNLNPASLGPVGVELQVNNGGIEGQIAANDANVRQLLNDSLPRLRQSLEALVSDNAGVNIELSDQRENGAKQQREPDIEIPLDLLAEEFIPLKEAIAGGNILRDGLSVFV
jgi:flagellar hook-length control protein FliK